MIELIAKRTLKERNVGIPETKIREEQPPVSLPLIPMLAENTCFSRGDCAGLQKIAPT
jgi:hypothetical protein